MTKNRNERPKVVIVGAGFGGLKAAKALGKAPVDITLIDRSNHHLFQPLLYQVATAGLSPADIAAPIRHILSHQKNTEVLLAEVRGVSSEAREVILDDRRLPYDYLVLATGARHGYFGHEAWETYAPGLKSLSDATAIRHKILLSFERAEMETNPAQRPPWLTFVLVGGGPTGVEMAGAIAELSHRALQSDFRRIDPRGAKVILVEAGPRILANFPEKLSQRAQRDLEKLGVEVLLNSRVENIDNEGVWIGGRCLQSKSVIWTAGVLASPAGQWLGAEVDRAGRVKVEKDLTVPGHPEIFVIGDTALAGDLQGKPLPGVAPVAMQQGVYVGKAIRRHLEKREPGPPFRYFDKGNLATIGRSSAVADFGTFRLTGFLAWITWLAVHIFFLIGFRNRVLVFFQWAWSYLTFQRGARIITTTTP